MKNIEYILKINLIISRCRRVYRIMNYNKIKILITLIILLCINQLCFAAEDIRPFYKFPDYAYMYVGNDKFEKFNIEMIGSGEGAAKRGKGIYLFRTKKFAPYFANIKSPDAPLHLGVSKSINNPNPHVYTVSGLKSMNFKKVSLADSKNISRMQESFERNYPDVDGIEMPNGEICVFPKSVEKLKIKHIDKLENFIMLNRGFPFRVWTTDKAKLTL